MKYAIMAKFKLYSSERGARLKLYHYRGATLLGWRYFCVCRHDYVNVKMAIQNK